MRRGAVDGISRCAVASGLVAAPPSVIAAQRSSLPAARGTLLRWHWAALMAMCARCNPTSNVTARSLDKDHRRLDIGETGFHDRRIGGSVRCEPSPHRGINGHASVSIGGDRSENDPGLTGITDQLDHERISDACLAYNNLLEPQCDRGHTVIRDVNKNGFFDADLVAARVEGVSRRHGHLSPLGSGAAHFKTGHDAPPVEHPIVSTGLGKEIGLFLIEVVVTHEHPEEVANALTNAVIVVWATSEVHGSAPRRALVVKFGPEVRMVLVRTP